MTYELRWDENFLPVYGNTISIPAGTILWRGFDPAYPVISDRPSYYGSQRFAQGYANRYGTNATPFITTRTIELLDVRFMKVLLSQLFEYNKCPKKERRIIDSVIVSFGLCTLQHQVKKFKEVYEQIYNNTTAKYSAIKMGINHLESFIQKEPIIEQRGYRIAESTNDAYVNGFLKELFYNHYDGYVAPNIYSPFHIEKRKFIVNSELVVFSPIDAGIKMLTTMPSRTIPISINGIILHSGFNQTTIDTRGMKTSYYSPHKKTGGKQDCEPCEDYNYLIDKGDKHIIQSYQAGRAVGRKWRINKPATLISAIAPGPSVPPTIFSHRDDLM